MNKFKKILLGALSVLTLGLFVATGARVSAAAGNGLIVDFGKTEDYGMAAASTKPTVRANTVLDGTIYEIKATNSSKCSVDTNSKTIDGHSLTGRFKTGQTSSATDASICVNAPSAGILRVYGMSSKATNVRKLSLYDDTYVDKNSTALDDGFSNDGNSIGGHTYSINDEGTYYLGTPDSGFNIYYIEFIPKSVTVMQQEATGQTIGTDDATYIRFIALVKGVTDINSSDFSFKIYREKDSVTQSITRSVSTYKALTYNSATYSATLPGESEVHIFNGNYDTEFYAVFVIGLTNADYSGYTVYSGFTYDGKEYTTTGYQFA